MYRGLKNDLKKIKFKFIVNNDDSYSRKFANRILQIAKRIV